MIWDVIAAKAINVTLTYHAVLCPPILTSFNMAFCCMRDCWDIIMLYGGPIVYAISRQLSRFSINLVSGCLDSKTVMCGTLTPPRFAKSRITSSAYRSHYGRPAGYWICRTGNSRTGKWRMKSQGWKMTDWNLADCEMKDWKLSTSACNCNAVITHIAYYSRPR